MSTNMSIYIYTLEKGTYLEMYYNSYIHIYHVYIYIYIFVYGYFMECLVDDVGVNHKVPCMVLTKHIFFFFCILLQELLFLYCN